MELEGSAIDIGALDPAAAAAAAGLAALAAEIAHAAAEVGQSHAAMEALPPLTTAPTLTNRCSCVPCVLLYRCPAG